MGRAYGHGARTGILADMCIASTILAAAFLAPSGPTAELATTSFPTSFRGRTPEPTVVHCQVPCGIYGDHLRIEMLLEHVATIEKAMGQIEELGGADKPNWNQLVRWVQTKEEHAEAIQDQVSAYWLTQRVKEPELSEDEQGNYEGLRRYTTQLITMHRLTTSAMRCKQTTDVANAAALRTAIEGFKAAYFTEEDKKHLEEHGEHVDEPNGSVPGRILSGLSRAKQDVAVAEVATIGTATDEYYMDNMRWPGTLKVLTEKGASGNSYIDGDKIKMDPWGNEYVLEVLDGGRGIEIKSLGADGKPGGAGEDADISLSDVKAGKWKR